MRRPYFGVSSPIDKKGPLAGPAAAVSSLRAKQAYLDGELCGVRPDGTTSFSVIQAASDAGKSDALVDLLYLDGETIGSAPLIDRKARLQPWIRHGLAAHCRRAGCGRNGLLRRRRSCCPTPASPGHRTGWVDFWKSAPLQSFQKFLDDAGRLAPGAPVKPILQKIWAKGGATVQEERRGQGP